MLSAIGSISLMSPYHNVALAHIFLCIGEAFVLLNVCSCVSFSVLCVLVYIVRDYCISPLCVCVLCVCMYVCGSVVRGSFRLLRIVCACSRLHLWSVCGVFVMVYCRATFIIRLCSNFSLRPPN
eukprot:GHVQ01006143.1.p2 GENE.GHVQ01006143.1~~GHVQ01006143.1.p2  ORF type:complete len:124 (+),score=6.96 GHVQ01006143.1:978-1349(+)